MKRQCCIFLLLLMFFSGCGRQQIENIAEPLDNSLPPIISEPVSIEPSQPSQNPSVSSPENQEKQGPLLLFPDRIMFSAEDHPELNLEFLADDRESILCDYCFTSEGTLLLLQLSENVYEYQLDGQLIGIYNLHLKEYGLTASRIASGKNGTLYLIDGRSNAVIIANREGVESISQICFTDVGLFSRFECTDEGILIVSYLTDSLEPVSATLDVSDKEAKVENQHRGYIVDKDLSFETTSVPSEDSRFSDTVILHLYSQGMPYREYAFTACRPQNVKLYGLEVLASSENELLARTYEWLPAPQTPGGVKTAVNYVMLDTTSMSVRTGDNIASFEIPRYYGDQCYFLSRDEKSLAITRLAFHCSEWNPSKDFSFSELTTVNGN